jgi:hypothetical protein
MLLSEITAVKRRIGMVQYGCFYPEVSFLIMIKASLGDHQANVISSF